MSGSRLLHAVRRHLPVLRQSESAECGLVCLAMVAAYYGYETDLPALRRRFSVSLKGISLHGLYQMAERLGLLGRGLRLELDDLKKLRLPCILHVDLDHFVVLHSVGRGSVLVHDPAVGRRRWSKDELSRRFTGIALELSPTPSFERKREIRRLSASDLWGHLVGLPRAMLQAIVLSLILQIFVLASPFYLQLAVDEVVLKGDQGLLVGLAAGFGLLLAIKLVAGWLRGRVLLTISTVASFQMQGNLFHRLVRLPLDFFEKRHMGDLLSRAHSVEPIREILSEGLVAAIVDGIMAILILGVLLLYSALLTSIVALSLVLYTVLRILLFRTDRRRQEDVIQAEAKHQTVFIETARAVQAVKLFGLEHEREALYQNRLSDTTRRRVITERLHLDFRTAYDLVYGVEHLAIVYLAALSALHGSMTVGMVFAFVSYKDQFLNSAAKLVEVAIKWRILDLHLERIADIAMTPSEPGLNSQPKIEHVMRGAIELRGLHFRYAETEPEIVGGLDLKIEEGEFVALIGSSGCGKTTVLKLMLGLLRPSKGEVLVDGQPLDRIGPAAFRAQIAAVMQDDHLLSGTVADNICGFAQNLDPVWMRECAHLAGIDNEIMAMVMNYNSRIGDMGSALSGGQRQRVLLARALYRRPRILFMDEATSQLDVVREREINKALSALRITRVVVAHRPEMIAAADRVIEMAGGVIVRDLRQHQVAADLLTANPLNVA